MGLAPISPMTGALLWAITAIGGWYCVVDRPIGVVVDVPIGDIDIIPIGYGCNCSIC